jgi:hypothetical protein
LSGLIFKNQAPFNFSQPWVLWFPKAFDGRQVCLLKGMPAPRAGEMRVDASGKNPAINKNI